MQEAHTPAGYFIAIIAVIGGAWLMPPLPIFILVIGPLLLLALCVCLGVRKVIRDRKKREEGRQVVGLLAGQHCHLPVENSTLSKYPTEEEKLETLSA